LTEKHDTIIALNMSEFNRKNKYNFWHSPLMLILLFCILVLFIYNIIGLMEKERETARKKDIILANIETLRNRESILTTDINKLKTEDGIEETIRDKYQVVKEGEKMVTIVDEEKKGNVEIEAPVEDSSFLGWIKRLFKI